MNFLTAKTLISRYNNYTFDENNLYVGPNMARDRLSEEFLEEIDYERPYFNVPSLDEAGNFFIFSECVEQRLKKLKYYKEAQHYMQLFNLCGTKKLDLDFYELTARFVDFVDFYKEVEVDGELYRKLKSNEDRQNSLLLKDIFLNKIKDKEITEDFFEPNMFGRSALFYVQDKQMLYDIYEYAKKQGNEFSVFFELDVFAQVPLYNCRPELFVDMLNIYKEISLDMTKRIMNSSDVFGVSPMGYISLNKELFDFDSRDFSDFKSFEKKYEKTVKFCLDMSFALEDISPRDALNIKNIAQVYIPSLAPKDKKQNVDDLRVKYTAIYEQKMLNKNISFDTLKKSVIHKI